MDLVEKYIGEASEVTFKDFDKNKQKFIADLVGKSNVKNQHFYSGIHGTIVNFNQHGTDGIRVKPADLKKIMANKDVRWIDIKSIGLGYNVKEDE